MANQIASFTFLNKSDNGLTFNDILLAPGPLKDSSGLWKQTAVCRVQRLTSRVRVRVSSPWTANQWKMEWTQKSFKYLKMFDFPNSPLDPCYKVWNMLLVNIWYNSWQLIAIDSLSHSLSWCLETFAQITKLLKSSIIKNRPFWWQLCITSSETSGHIKLW